MKNSQPNILQILGRKNAALLLLAASLSSCMTTDRQSQPASQQPSVEAAPQTIVSAASGPAPIVVSETPNSQISAQQQAIQAINRNGFLPQFSGYRERSPSTDLIEGEDVVELNYEQADLRLVLEELADALGISIIIDPAIDDKVSVRTAEANPLAKEDIWPLIRLLTRDAGVLLEREGNIFTARKLAGNLPIEITTPENLGDGSSANIMQITPITYISADTALGVIEPLLETEGSVVRVANSNFLAITTSESKLVRINQLLSLVDSDPFSNQGIQLYQLANGSAVDVAEELTSILQMIEGGNPAYQVRGIERINAVLVTAPANRGFDDIAMWITVLDADSQERVEQLFHYRVKNLSAVELAATLSEVFEEEDEDEPLPLLVDQVDQGNSNATANNTNTDAQPTEVISSASVSQASTAVSADLKVKIVADEASNSLLIRSTARDYRQLLTTISQLDAVPLQVMINAVIAQITLTDATRFGVDWSRVANDSTLNSISTTTATTFRPPGVGGLMFTKSFLDGAARVEATLDAIATNNEVTLLARPSLTVINNQEGEIQIGAEVPIQQGESISAGGLSTTNIQYRPTGIELYITPQINDDNVVNLTIRQVLSSVNNSAPGVGSNPIFNNQEISTTVVVRDGENIVLGGLIQDNAQKLNSGVPGLHRIPILGKLFSFQTDSLERQELFIVIRPEVVNLNERGGLQYEAILDRFDLISELFAEAGL